MAVLLGFLIRSNCAPALTASILMAQETSGVALNYYLLMRHRSPHHWSVLTSQICFTLCFYIWRLLIGTYGTYHYLYYAGQHLPAEFPDVAARALGIALVVASVLQWYWGLNILRRVVRNTRRKAKKA